MPRIDLIQPRGGTAAEWTSANPILEVREMGEETDTGKSKRGDGVTAWNSLPYFGGSGTQDLQDVIAQDPVATSVPTFSGGLLVGDAGNGFIAFSDGAFASAAIIVAPTSFLITADSGNYILSKRRLDPIGGQIVSVSETGYNVSTNNLNLSDSDVEMDGFECVVEVAGTRDFGSGNIVLGVGDVLANNGSIYYKKVDNNQVGTTPTIQEVLTEGNEITRNTQVNFKGLVSDAVFSNNFGTLNLNASGLEIESNTTSSKLLFNADTIGISAQNDYSSYTTGTTAFDEKIYAQRKYVDDAVAAAGSETATYSATSTAVTTLDCDTFDSRYQILTVNTDIQWSNTPAIGESFVKTLEVIGAFSLSFSTSTKIIGTYNDDGSTVNIITVNFANYPTVGLRTTVMINS